MSINLKRILCAVFAFCLIISMLSACGGSSDNGGDTSTTSTPQKIEGDDSKVSYITASGTEEDKDYYETMPESIKGTTVRFATWINHNQTEGQKPLMNIEKDIGIKAELMILKSVGYIDSVVAKIASNDIPDVVKTNEDSNCFPLTLQIVQPINKCSSVPLDDPIWDQTMLKTATIDGNVYFVNTIGSPWSGSNLTFYNKALFEENGFKTPEEYYAEGNWTWATLEKVLKDIKSLGEDYKPGLMTSDNLAGSAGVSFCKYDYETANFTSGISDPNLVAAYETYAEWRAAGLLGGGWNEFKTGKTGIVITGTYGLRNTGHFVGMDFNDIGFTYLPAIDGSQKSLTSSVHRMYGVCAGAPNADAAGWFIRYWLDPKNYDLEKTFISNAAGNFYFELINNPASNKYFSFDDGCAGFVGAKGAEVFNSGASTTTAAQVNTKIQSVANLVTQACSGANALIQQVKDTYK